MKIYPAIDLLDGQVVRLREGKRDQVTVYDRDPVALAAGYRAAGASMIHVVDLNGAFDQSDVQAPLLARLIAEAGVAVQVGGGIRSAARAAAYVAQGCARIVIGTAALDTALLEQLCAAHPGKVVVAVDAKDGMVATHGWTEVSDMTALALALRAQELGAAAVLYTDVSRDGTGVGPNIEATSALQAALAIEVIASGGIGNLGHLQALADQHVQATVIGRALFENAFTLQEAYAHVG